LNVDAILISQAYCTWSPQPSQRATCQPIIATAGARFPGIGFRLPEPDTLRSIYLSIYLAIFICPESIKNTSVWQSYTADRTVRPHWTVP